MTDSDGGGSQSAQAIDGATTAAGGAQQLASDPAGAAAEVATGAAGVAAAAGAPQAQQAQQAMSAAGQVVSSAQAAQHDPVGGLLGLIGGAAGVAGAAAGANEAAGQVASGVSAAAGIARGVASAASAASSMSSASTSSAASDESARAHGNIGPAEALGGLWPGAGSRDDVHANVEVAGLEGVLLGVRSVELEEELNSVPRAVIEMRCDGDLPEMQSLLGAECSLAIERSTETRGFHGLVYRGQVSETVDGPVLRLHVSPAFGLLKFIADSRIYQDKTVIDVVTEIFHEKLKGRERTIRNDCQRTHPTHEYLVQYNETYLAFVDRLLEQEGIFYYFEHDDEREVLVLCDSPAACQPVRQGDGGRVPYVEDAAPDHEAITSIKHAERIGTTDAVISGYNWTNPPVTVREAKTGRGQGTPALEDHDLDASVAYHSYDGDKYAELNAIEQSEIAARLLDQARQRWVMHGTVVTAHPGRRFELTGSPDGLDAEYLILAQQTRVVMTEGTQGTISETLRCHPVGERYHPPRRTPMPVVHGLESAVVVGRSGEEIHTDQHRRVRVQFHWDRLGKKNEHSSCFIRVAQMWAGDGWGTLFLPRVGMEVIVSFLGGHPHRPVVIGSLYNGANKPPYTTDEDGTKSTIRTNSSPGGDGFNELRFEDAAGSEEIFVHAQKDMNERVLNNHSTSVGGNQSNSVTGDRTHSVSKNETITVTGSQKITISGEETGEGQEIQGAQLDIKGKYKLDADDEIMVQAPNSVRIDVGSTYIEMTPSQIKLHCGGSTLILESAQAELKSNGNSVVRLNADAKVVSSGAAEIYLNAHAKMNSQAGSNVHLEGGNAKLVANAGASVQLTADALVDAANATLQGSTQATVGAPTATLAGDGGSVEAAGAGVTATGGQVNVSGGTVNITGGMVAIN